MSASTVLETRPTIDIINLMQTRRDHRTYLNRMEAVRKILQPIGKTLVHAHQCLLGRQSFCWTGSEFRFWIWEQPTYRLFVSNQKGICLEVPQDATRDDAFDALEQYRMDVQVVGGWLTGSESVHLEYLGRDAIKGNELEIPTYSDDDIREFVLAYCDGRVWTDLDVRADVGMVFMPILFGALDPPDDIREKAVENFPPDPGDEPEHPNRPPIPEPPALPATPERPPEPEWFQEDPEKVADIEHKIGWQAADNTDLDNYRVYIESQNQMLRDSYDETLDDWECRCETVWAEQKKVERKGEREIEHYKQHAEADWRAECVKVDGARTEWRMAKERRDAAHYGMCAQYTKDMGVLWEFASKAGPRAVNGCPVFTSCRLMGRDDWGRAYEAIGQEMKRRGELKV